MLQFYSYYIQIDLRLDFYAYIRNKNEIFLEYLKEIRALTLLCLCPNFLIHLLQLFYSISISISILNGQFSIFMLVTCSICSRIQGSTRILANCLSLSDCIAWS